MKYTINAIHLNHPKTVSQNTTPHLWKKMSSTKPVPVVKKIGDHWPIWEKNLKKSGYMSGYIHCFLDYIYITDSFSCIPETNTTL